jgi:hypothetical protein
MNSPRSHEGSARHRLGIDDLPQLASLGQTAEVMGLTVPQIRGLIRAGLLAYVSVGCRRLFVPKGAIARFIAENTVHPRREAKNSADSSGSGTLPSDSPEKIRELL